MTTVSSWMMMLAVIYGMMPSAKIDSWSSAPPLNMFAKPMRPPPEVLPARHWRILV